MPRRSDLLLALSLSVLPAAFGQAAAAPIFVSSTPGLYTTNLGAGTYDIVVAGGSGGAGYNAPGGLGAVVEGLFTFSDVETLTLLVAGRGGDAGLLALGGLGGGGTFVVDMNGVPLLVAGGGGGGGVYNGTNQTVGSISGANGGPIATTGGAGGSYGLINRYQGGGGGGGGYTGGDGGPGLGGSYPTNGGQGGLGGTSFDAGDQPS